MLDRLGSLGLFVPSGKVVRDIEMCACGTGMIYVTENVDYVAEGGKFFGVILRRC